VIWRDCFEGVQADLRITYTRQAFESDVIIREDITAHPEVAAELLADPTFRLETWTEFIDPPRPRIAERVLAEETDPVRRAAMVEPDLVDAILDFGDLLFVEGKAFDLNQDVARDGLTPARIDLVPDGGAEQKSIPVAKRWLEQDGRFFLIESTALMDLVPVVGALPTPEFRPGQPAMESREEVAKSLPRKMGVERECV